MLGASVSCVAVHNHSSGRCICQKHLIRLIGSSPRTGFTLGRDANQYSRFNPFVRGNPLQQAFSFSCFLVVVAWMNHIMKCSDDFEIALTFQAIKFQPPTIYRQHTSLLLAITKARAASKSIQIRPAMSDTHGSIKKKKRG